MAETSHALQTVTVHRPSTNAWVSTARTHVVGLARSCSAQDPRAQPPRNVPPDKSARGPTVLTHAVGRVRHTPSDSGVIEEDCCLTLEKALTLGPFSFQEEAFGKFLETNSFIDTQGNV